MAVSKPILLALVGAILAAVAFYGTQSTRSDSAEEAASAPSPAAKSEPSAADAPKATAAKAQPPAAERPAPEGVPAAVLRANAAQRTVVLFFFQRGADDKAVRSAVASLKGQRKVSVFQAPISKISDYRALTGELGVAQAPAVVVIGRRGSRLVEGYVDAGSLAQEVADAR